mmetsp:Transcript_19474/g.74733  ORF Transcript_19474/g.74733 Transcript_19474/m.74733 type:complete len:234 (+) Transcript_19474:494-1195(+)
MPERQPTVPEDVLARHVAKPVVRFDTVMVVEQVVEDHHVADLQSPMASFLGEGNLMAEHANVLIARRTDNEAVGPSNERDGDLILGQHSLEDAEPAFVLRIEHFVRDEPARRRRFLSLEFQSTRHVERCQLVVALVLRPVPPRQPLVVIVRLSELEGAEVLRPPAEGLDELARGDFSVLEDHLELEGEAIRVPDVHMVHLSMREGVDPLLHRALLRRYDLQRHLLRPLLRQLR